MSSTGRFSSVSTFDWLALERIPRVGPLTFARLLEAFGSPRSAMEANSSEIVRRAGLSEKMAQTISDFRPRAEEINEDMEALARLGARVITRWDETYPENLKEIHDPPALLFVRGEVLPADAKAVAIVGTRNPTRYGMEMAERITRDLVRAGVAVISGLARGIDTACHRIALKEGGRTIGVLGCGLDCNYPRENEALVQEMAVTGAVISEFRPRVPPLATNFYRRNRIISGLSKGVLVVEAARNSGSLITAAHALDQNRDVFAVPGNVLNKRSEGPHHLLKEGAGLVESAEDLLGALFHTPDPAPQPSLFDAQDGDEDLSESSRAVLEALDPDPATIDSLCEALKADAATISAALLDLELRGLARHHPGNMFSRRTP